MQCSQWGWAKKTFLYLKRDVRDIDKLVIFSTRPLHLEQGVFTTLIATSKTVG